MSDNIKVFANMERPVEMTSAQRAQFNEAVELLKKAVQVKTVRIPLQKKVGEAVIAYNVQTKPKRIRKPNCLQFNRWGYAGIDWAEYSAEPDEEKVTVDGCYDLTSKECRRLAKWLLRAAEWMESRGAR